MYITSSTYFGDKFPKLLKAKNWKKTPDDNTVFGSQIKG
jgi:hypothetical protein